MMSTPLSSPRRPDHPVDAQFIDRWSPRAFGPETMDPAAILTILEAARWAPSASNRQPWRFVWSLRGEAGFDAVAAALVPNNRSWAAQAAALVVVASRMTAMSPEGEVPNKTHAFDTGTAWGHLALQTHLMGYAAHAMGGFDPALLATAVMLPADHALHAVVALGRRSDPDTLPEKLREREAPNGRLPLGEVTRHGSF
jgi:nitroreductase